LGYLAVCWWRKPAAVQLQVPSGVRRDQWLKQLVGLAGNTLIRAGMAYASQHLAKALRKKCVEAGSRANGDEEWAPSHKPR
jgi:hypothetical protein